MMTLDFPTAEQSCRWHVAASAAMDSEARLDTCAYGADEDGHLIRKPTRLLGLRAPWLGRLARRCPGYHAHCRGGGACTSRAPEYAPALVDAEISTGPRLPNDAHADRDRGRRARRAPLGRVHGV